MAAKSVDYVMGAETLSITTTDDVVHELTGVVLLGGNTLAYDSDGNVIIRVGLLTAKFVLTPPVGAALTFDKRMGVALGRLGVNVSKF